MKLYHSPASPFVRKVRIAALELRLDDRIELVSVAVAPAKPNPDYAAEVNPLRKVPALATDDGQVIFDSAVIVEYLAAEAGDTTLFPNGPQRWRVLTRHALANGMCESAVQMRYETFLRPPEQRWDAWTEDHRDKIAAGLAAFEMAPPEPGSPLDVASIALGACLGYLDFRFPQDEWRSRCPRLATWFEVAAGRRSFVETAPD